MPLDLADIEGRRCLCSASSPSLIVRRTRLSTVGDRAFPFLLLAYLLTNVSHTTLLYFNRLSWIQYASIPSWKYLCYSTNSALQR